MSDKTKSDQATAAEEKQHVQAGENCALGEDVFYENTPPPTISMEEFMGKAEGTDIQIEDNSPPDVTELLKQRRRKKS